MATVKARALLRVSASSSASGRGNERRIGRRRSGRRSPLSALPLAGARGKVVGVAAGLGVILCCGGGGNNFGNFGGGGGGGGGGGEGGLGIALAEDEREEKQEEEPENLEEGEEEESPAAEEDQGEKETKKEEYKLEDKFKVVSLVVQNEPAVEGLPSVESMVMFFLFF